MLTENKTNLLENIELIEKLEMSKKLSTEIGQKVEIAKKTGDLIEVASEAYRPVAIRGALIFFLMNELYKMSSFYMYSLESFVNVINLAVDSITDPSLLQKLTATDEVKKEGSKSLKGSQDSASGDEEGEEEEEKKEGSADDEDNGDEDLVKKGSSVKDEEEKKEEKEGSQAKEGEGAEENAENSEKEGSSDGEGDEEVSNKSIEEPGQEKVDEQDDGEIAESMTPRSLGKRVDLLTETITYKAFNFVRRGLFEKHKLIFATLMTFRILVNLKKLNPDEVEHLIIGKPAKGKVIKPETDALSYISEQQYADCKALEYIDCFNGLCDSLAGDYLAWKKWYGAEKAEETELPKNFKEIEFFHKMMLIKALRPDRMTYSLRNFANEQMGKRYTEQPPFNMDEIYAETTNQTPVFFVLFPGVDPTPDVEKLGLKFDITTANGKFVNISMGQGQELRAIDELEKACKEGTWIFLQNVHLMQSWLKMFERKLEEFSIGANPMFRCYVSSEPPPTPNQKIVPEAILQKCIKISNEAPSDLMANMQRAYSKFSQERIDAAPQTNVFKSILFGLCYFHAVVLGRKKFGSAGWSRTYNFNDGDLTICADVLENYLDKYDKVPYDDLRYIYGEIMYGGHITDDWDRRTNNTYLKVIVTPELMNKTNIVPFSKKMYRVPDPAKSNYKDYQEKIEQFSDERPFMFGMHSNAEINFLTNQCEYTFNTIIDIRGEVGGAAGDGDAGAMSYVETYKNIPAAFIMVDLKNKVTQLNKDKFKGSKSKVEEGDTFKYPPTPYQNVALQEMEQMSELITEIVTSLNELELGLKGDLNMTDNMEYLSTCLMLNRVPTNWGVFYHSKKPLASWFEDLKARKEQLDEWSIDFNILDSTCLSYLFNPMSFLTAIMQVTASEQGEALDSMCLNTRVTSYHTPEEIVVPGEGDEEEKDTDSQKEEYPYPNSVFIHGMFLEGAAWEMTQRGGYLVEMKAKELHPPLPVIAVDAILLEKKSMKAQYTCPVYYTTMRGPTFVFTANLGMESDEQSESDKWILGGVAVIMNEDI